MGSSPQPPNIFAETYHSTLETSLYEGKAAVIKRCRNRNDLRTKVRWKKEVEALKLVGMHVRTSFHHASLPSPSKDSHETTRLTAFMRLFPTTAVAKHHFALRCRRVSSHHHPPSGAGRQPRHLHRWPSPVYPRLRLRLRLIERSMSSRASPDPTPNHKRSRPHPRPEASPRRR